VRNTSFSIGIDCGKGIHLTASSPKAGKVATPEEVKLRRPWIAKSESRRDLEQRTAAAVRIPASTGNQPSYVLTD
jgi:hypothetical protein